MARKVNAVSPRFRGVSFPAGMPPAFASSQGPKKKQQRDMPSPIALLAKAERKLRAGRISEAMNLFEEIVNEHVPSLERLAALAYLRRNARKPPRRVGP